jgi:hypothetical protein
MISCRRVRLDATWKATETKGGESFSKDYSTDDVHRCSSDQWLMIQRLGRNHKLLRPNRRVALCLLTGSRSTVRLLLIPQFFMSRDKKREAGKWNWVHVNEALERRTDATDWPSFQTDETFRYQNSACYPLLLSEMNIVENEGSRTSLASLNRDHYTRKTKINC